MNFQEIEPFKNKISAVVDVSNSKSLSLRALILASLAEGESVIKGVLNSTDIDDCVNVLKSLGINIEKNNNDFKIKGCGGIFPTPTKINFGSSGVTCRFLTAIICASLSRDKNQYEIVADGSEQLKSRPIKPLIDSLIKMGANIEYNDEIGHLPIKIKTAKLNNLENIEISGKDSSQFVSAILMMSPLLEEKSTINIKDIDSGNPYIQMAIETMKYFGISDIKETKTNVYEISPKIYEAREFSVETDLNTASYFLALTAILGGQIEIKDVNKNSTQPALKFFNILEKMGCKINFNGDNLILKSNSKLKGGWEINMFEMAELTTLLAVLSVFADTPITIFGVQHIRGHESDRIKAISTELRKAGIQVEEFEDGLKVTPGIPQYFIADTYNDHRIAMPLIILGMCAKGVKILNSDCLSKTCPDFFNLIEKIKEDSKKLYVASLPS